MTWSDAHADERRLHPASLIIFSWNAITQLLPLIVLGLISGKADFEELGFWALLGVAAIVMGSLKYFTFRYRVEAEQISTRSGLMFRQLRQLRFARVQNLSVVRSPLHRLLGLSLVRIESGSGVGDDVRLDAVTPAQIEELRAMVSGHQGAQPELVQAERALLKLSTIELVRLGLISNRGMLVVAALFGFLMQNGSERTIFRLGERWLGPLWTQVNDAHLGWVGNVLLALAMLSLALILVRLLSVGLSIVQFHGFELSAKPDRVVAHYGLLTRVQAALKFARIQQIAIEETLLHRWFARASVRVRSAAVQAVNDSVQQLSWLAPVIARNEQLALLKRVQPEIEWGQFNWQPIAKDALGLVLLVRMAAFAVMLAIAFGVLGPHALWGLLLLPLVALSAWLYVRRTRIHVSEQSVAVFHGGINHLTLVSRVGRIQGLRMTQGLLQREFGLATIEVDVAGSMGAGMRQLTLPLLEIERAQQLLTQLLVRA